MTTSATEMTSIKQLLFKESDKGFAAFGLQISVDTVAYAQNLPLRFLNLDRLNALPQVLAKMLAGEENSSDSSPIPHQLLFNELNRKGIPKEDVEEAIKKIQALENKENTDFEQFAKWVVSLATQHPDEKPAHCTKTFLHAILVLLPNLEQRIWATEMGNPLPAHLISRMVEHWSLFVLCWCYLNLKPNEINIQRNKLTDTSNKEGGWVSIHSAFGVDFYELMVSRAFSQIGQHWPNLCVVAGPYWVTTKNSEGCHTTLNKRNEFSRIFNTFIKNLKDHVPVWADASNKAPTDDELSDALSARIDMRDAEVLTRAKTVYRTFDQYFFPVDCANTNTEGGEWQKSRANWETMSALACWFARWDKVLQKKAEKNKPYAIRIDQHRAHLEVYFSSPTHHTNNTSAQSFQFKRSTANTQTTMPCLWQTVHDQLTQANAQAQLGFNINHPDVFFNRLRERQQASWTAQIIALNNLLNGHSNNDPLENEAATIGANDVLMEGKPRLGNQTDEVDHLLRGYTGRICHHLISLTRSDLADIYWIDYAQNPPRLVHTGGYAKGLRHRLHRHTLHTAFDNTIYGKDAPNSDAARREDTASLAYRVAFNKKAIHTDARNSTGEKINHAHFGHFDEIAGRAVASALGIPLLVHGRAVGVLTLAGYNENQFNDRLFLPLRRASNLIAHTMYQASHMWQMRQLSWLASHIPFWMWKKHDEENQFNPLKFVSQALCNVFLCRAAHIWLESAGDNERYLLHGYNQPRIFSDLKDAPYFDYIKSNSNETHAENIMRASACFCLDQANTEKFPKNLGYFQVSSYQPEGENDAYTATAADQGMRLGAQYLEFQNSSPSSAPNAKYRKQIFQGNGRDSQGEGLNDMLVCALLQDARKYEAEKPTYKPVGALTLHDVWSGKAQDSDPNRAWSKAWRQTIAHVQTWLPNLLTHVEIHHNPMDNLRRFLMHSIRGELIPVRDTMKGLLSKATPLHPDGSARTDLRRLEHLAFDLTKHKDREVASAAHTILNLNASATKLIQGAWMDVTHMIDPNRIDDISKLVFQIENVRQLTWAGVDATAGKAKFNVLDHLNKILSEHQAGFLKRRLDARTLGQSNGFKHNLQLNLEFMWWNQLITTLIENAAKYAHEVFNVTWDDENKTLLLENQAPWSEPLDKAHRLVRMGERGFFAKQSQEKGLGLGLWGAQMICDLLNVKFEFDISPLSSTIHTAHPLAWYRFKLTLPRHVVFYGT